MSPVELFVYGLLVGVPFLAGLIYLVEEAKQYKEPLRRLVNAKLIGLAILTLSMVFGFNTTLQVVIHPETVVSSLPTLGLCILGFEAGSELLAPSNSYL